MSYFYESLNLLDIDKAMQGCFLRFADAEPFDITWRHLIGPRNPRLITWVLNASINSVITPDSASSGVSVCLLDALNANIPKHIYFTSLLDVEWLFNSSDIPGDTTLFLLLLSYPCGVASSSTMSLPAKKCGGLSSSVLRMNWGPSLPCETL